VTEHFGQVVSVMPTPEGWWIGIWDLKQKKRLAAESTAEQAPVEVGVCVQFNPEAVTPSGQGTTLWERFTVVPQSSLPPELQEKLPYFTGTKVEFLRNIANRS
jgi:hypothetical protein